MTSAASRIAVVLVATLIGASVLSVGCKDEPERRRKKRKDRGQRDQRTREPEIDERTVAKLRAEREREQEAERRQQLETAKRNLEAGIRAAESAAEADDWPRAEKHLQRGAKLLMRSAKLDAEATLTAYYESAEQRLRRGRRDYMGLSKDLEDGNYTDAGIAFKALSRRKGPFYRLAKKRIDKAKAKLLAKAEALLAADGKAKALVYFGKASKLDPTDKALRRRFRQVKNPMFIDLH